jgi:dTMP kinase
MPRGLFIVLEGVDGAGSTTQTHLLADSLNQQGIPAIATKEPTEGRIGHLIRSYLQSSSPHPSIDALLFAADRIEHLETIVKPALERGDHVISDRYVESTLAYQSVDGVDTEWIEAVNQFAMKPDVVIILDINPETSLSRKQDPTRERFETVEFLSKVRQNFKKRAATQGYELVDAEKPIKQVHEALKKIILPKIEATK